MLSQLSYFPTWTPQRGVARYVCHSSAAVKSFLCTGRPSVRREGPDIRGMQGPVSYEAGSGKQEDIPAPMTARMERSSCPPLAPIVSRAFSSWYAGRRAPAFSRNAWAKPGRSEAGLRTSAQSVRTRGISKATPSGWQTSRHAGQSLRHPRGPLLPPSLKKIGRAAPVGAWLPRKKTL